MNKYCLIALALFSVSTLKAQVFYNKGAMSVQGGSSTTASLYIKGDMVVGGSDCNIAQVGKTVLTGDFVNKVTNGNVFSSTIRSGTIEFKGSTSAQHIRGTANKATNYIHFPDIVAINNSNPGNSNDSAVVVMDPLMGATVTELLLTRGRFVLDSRISGDKTDIAHLLVEGGVDYNRVPSSKHEKGIIQVNLAMGDNPNHGGLMGFSSPFETMYSDYFFFNFLSVPKQDMFFQGNRDLWELSPERQMKAGEGYVIGQGIVPHGDPYYTDKKNPTYASANYADVAKERFSFARDFAPASLTSFNATKTDAFTGEELNISTVSVNVTEGFNYLGNPFTAPLDMTTFLNNPTSANWGNFASGDLAAGIYILSPTSTGSYNSSSGTFSFTANHLLIQNIGSTATERMLAPMQMFAIKKNTAGTKTFKLYEGARTHGNIQFLRSDADDSPVDELLIETKDQQTGGYDRICVVFRNTASLKANDTYDAEKLFNTTGGVNQLYTRSSDNVDLTTNVIPTTTERLQMYFEPSAIDQEVSLTADRISSLQSIGSAILEDRKTGQKTDLITTPSYTFTSSPTDSKERFVLHFRTNTIGVEDLPGDMLLTASYANGVISLQGLQEENMNQPVSVYSIQGQLLYQQKITGAPSCKLYKPLPTGIYVLKIEGNPHVIKLSVR